MRRTAIFLFIVLMVGTGLVYATDSKQTATGKQAGSIHSKAPRDAAQAKPQETAASGNRVGTAQSTIADEQRKRDNDSSIDYAQALEQFRKGNWTGLFFAVEKHCTGEAQGALWSAAAGGDVNAQRLLALYYTARNSPPEYEDILKGIQYARAAVARGDEYAKKWVEATCVHCEQMAARNVQYLRAALERVDFELRDLGKSDAERRKFMNRHADKIIRYVHGPFYGDKWTQGTDCRTRYRLVEGELRACTPIRAVAGLYPETAKIFRAPLFGEGIESAGTGPCEGVEFSSDWPCYITSMWFLKGLPSPQEPIPIETLFEEPTPILFQEPTPMNCRKLKRSIELEMQGGGGTDWHDIARAARDGDAEAQFKLAAIYTDGESLPQELIEAVKWLEKAAAQSHEGAKAELPRVKARLAEMKNK